jgi:hypothetical protein
MMHFERILTILLHFLAGAPDRLYFTPEFYVYLWLKEKTYPQF